MYFYSEMQYTFFPMDTWGAFFPTMKLWDVRINKKIYRIIYEKLVSNGRNAKASDPIKIQ